MNEAARKQNCCWKFFQRIFFGAAAVTGQVWRDASGCSFGKDPRPYLNLAASVNTRRRAEIDNGSIPRLALTIKNTLPGQVDPRPVLHTPFIHLARVFSTRRVNRRRIQYWLRPTGPVYYLANKWEPQSASLLQDLQVRSTSSARSTCGIKVR
jgi:hypothetical protein